MDIFAEQVDPAEAARVVEDHPARTGGSLHLQNHMVMLADGGPLMMDSHRSRHAKMHQHRLIAIKRHQQELATSGQRSHHPAGQARRQIVR